MRIHRAFTLCLAALAAVACDATRKAASESRVGVSCVRCHGGEEDQSGAPPRDVLGRSLATLPSVGAHPAHVAAGVDCGACHVKPARADDGHVDGRTAVVWGPIATAGGALSPAYDREGDAPTYACSSVYCHGSFDGGNAATAPSWTAAGQGQAACGTCHGDPAASAPALPRSGHGALAPGATNASCAPCHGETVDAAGRLLAGGKHVNGVLDADARGVHPGGWADPSSLEFHGEAAAVDPNGCKDCHAVRAPATVTSVTCADCHLGGQDWTTTCNGCHGDATSTAGAPPADVRGNTARTAVGVGAHRRHVEASAVSGPLDCVFCHVKPSDAYDAGHLDGGVTVTAAGASWDAARADLGWNRATATCATSYCHGGFGGGNAANVPVWTAEREEACGTCHGTPPGGVHPVVSSDLRGCSPCHSDSIDADGNVLPAPGGSHLNGQVDRVGGHSAAFLDDPASGEFHAYAANRGLASCQGCHASDLSGGFTEVACADCHGAGWRTSCRMCHGDRDDPAATGAPPRTIWGYGGDPVRTGAHTAHVEGGDVFGPIDCGVCHPKPTDALSAGHVDTVPAGAVPTASVVFGGLAVTDGAGSTWDRANASCVVYCHGATLAVASAGTHTAPSWTGGDEHGRCGSCHALPPGGTHPPSPQCGNCHVGYGATTVNLDTHLDGEVAQPTLDCFSCHGDRSRPATARNPLLPAAPPAGTRGEMDVANRAVGSHQLHLAGTLTEGVACGECHAPPTMADYTEGRHPTGAVDLAFGGAAAGTTFDPEALTCATSYCHGAFALGDAANLPKWTEPRAQACGTCHALPPPSPHPSNAECERCHPGYSVSSVDPAKHVNGQLDADLDCTSCHGAEARTSTLPTCPTSSPLCVDPNLKVAPPITATGRPAGAHLAHVGSATRAAPASCEECHAGKVPAPTTAHPSSTIDVGFGGRATSGGAAPSYDAATGCSATYCHGNYSGVYTYSEWDYNCGDDGCAVPVTWSYAGRRATVLWTGGATTCGSCHGDPPSGFWHSALHGSRPSDLQCSLCHPDASGDNTTGGVGITNAARHVDGVVDVTPAFESRCFGCH